MAVDVRLCLRMTLTAATVPSPEAVEALRSAATLVVAQAAAISDRGAVPALRALRAALPPEIPVLAVGRVDLALAAGLEGVVLGPDALTPGDARRLLGPAAIVGVDVQHPAQADELYRWRADFACIGGPDSEAGGEPRPPPPEHLSRAAFRVRLASPDTAVVAVVAADAAPDPLIGAGANGFCLVYTGDLTPDARAARALRARIASALPRPASA